MPATLSLLGLYNYDPTVLDSLLLPASVDRSVFINNLLINCAELEILYPQPETLKFAVGAWSAERLPIWERLAKTTQYEYDPISNYDRKEEWTDDSEDSETSTTSVNRGASGTEDSERSETRTVAGFNSAGSNVPDSDAEVSDQRGYSSNANESGTMSNSVKRSNLRKGRAYGNIGVTTTQQMIEEERKVSRFDLEHEIISEFRSNFCLLIY